MSKLQHKVLGFMGFIGFLGLGYFQSGDINKLSYFAFFGFFAYFWVGSIANSIADELYIHNSRKAKTVAYNLALFEFLVLFIVSPLNIVSKELLVMIISFCFASLIICYAIAFYRYESG